MKAVLASLVLLPLLMAEGTQVRAQAPASGNQAQASKITLGTLEWEPYVGPQLPGKGAVSAIVTEAFQAVGYEPEITFYPWARALALGTSGRIDALFPEYDDARREAAFSISAPFAGGPLGLLVRTRSGIHYTSDPALNPTAALWALRHHRFGIVRGYINTKAIDTAFFLVKEEAASDEQNIHKLLAGRVDCVVIDRNVAEYLMRTRFPKSSLELTFLDPPLEIRSFHVIFSKKVPGHERMREAFNEGLARLKQSGRLDAILRAHGL